MRWPALLLGVVLSGCSSDQTVVYLFSSPKLAGAAVALEGKPVATVDGDGVATFSVSHKKHLAVVTKAGFAPIEIVIDTTDGSGEIYPTIDDSQLRPR